MRSVFGLIRLATSAARTLICIALLGGASPAHAGTLSGTVRNGTSGQLASGVDVILIQLQGGMQPLQTVKTDAQGHYQFDNPQLGAAPMLVRVVYRGVNYHEPIPPGKTTADVEVYEPTDKAGAFTVPNHAIIVQPRGPELMVGEEYNITNKTSPPVAYYRADGSFQFTIPSGAVFDQASAWGASGMPVVQATIDKGKNAMALAFPFRPGESGVRVSYKIPYEGNHATLRNVSAYPSERLIIAAPPSVEISGQGITSAGQDQGMSIYIRDNVAASQPIDIAVSGTAPMPAQPAQGQIDAPPGNTGGPNDPSVNSRADSSGGTESPTATATAIPARIDNLKWILVSGFGAIFLLGFIYLMRKPHQVAVRSAPAAIAAVSAVPVATAQTVGALAAVDQEVRGGLDELKDGLFRLELRRQAGTITEAEYAQERARVEKVLRELVRG